MTQAPSAQRISRARIVELGRTQPGWRFLSLAAQALRVAPHDDEVRLLAGRSLAALGLGGPARMVLTRVEAAEATRERDRLLATLETSGAIDLDARIAQARANLALVKGLASEDAIERWLGEGTDYFRAVDGNVLRVPRGADDLPEVQWLGDLIGAAREFCRAHLGNAAREPMGPITIEGVSPPWLMLAIDRATPMLGDGYQPLLQIVQRDPAELAEGFALVDARSVLARAKVFTGDDAGERLERHLLDRFDLQAVGPVIPASTLRTPVQPPPSALMQRLASEQQAEASRLVGALVARDRQRDATWWRARYAEPGAKRVLIPTCRFSTFIRHASEDLAAAFREQGWEAKVLIEPNAHSRFSTLAYHRAEQEFDPDLIVLINYPRPSRSSAFVTQTPFVCWVQDAMPHLFDERVGRGHGPRDFVIGHVYPQLFRQFGYPSDRALSAPVVVHPRKFHDRPVDGALRERLACDVAYVSHHSETPEQMHQRLCREAGDPVVVRVIERMRQLIAERYDDGLSGRVERAFKEIAPDAWRDVHGQTPAGRALDQLRDQYLVPMLERMLRHEMLEWTARICERRGWQLRIFGRGWERHDRFARFAGGELAHGEELRASYQLAGVHLHASMTTLTHQRVMECALSGGLPLCRSVWPVFGASRRRVMIDLLKGDQPDRVEADGTLVYRVDAHQPLVRLSRVHERAGLELGAEMPLHPRTAEQIRQCPVAFEVTTPEDLLGEPVDAVFRTPEDLERRIERAVVDADWRREQSGAIAERVREGLTHDALVRRLVELVSTRL